MPQTTINVNGSSEMDLLTRKTILEKIEKMPTDMLKRLDKLSSNEKAKSYMSSDLKFAILQKFL